MFIGCAFIILGVILECTAKQLGQFWAGRFFLGFGGMNNYAAVMYVIEIAHPAHRGTLGGAYNCFYYAGSLLAAGVLRASVVLTTNAAWQIPTAIQAVGAIFVCVAVPFIPESPRWLFTHGHADRARAILTKYHGEGNPESISVRFQLQEFESELNLTGSDKRWWDYRGLFQTSINRHRVMVACSVPVLAQLCGQGVVGYFLPALLSTAGVTDANTVLDINLGIAAASGIAATIGASYIDRIGRRPLVISVCLALSGVWIAIVSSSAVFADSPTNHSAAIAAIVFINMESVVFSVGFTALQALYPSEVLSYEQRAKGMAVQGAAAQIAGLFNQFGMPVAIQKIAWKTYIIFVIVCAVEAVILYLYMVETRGYTLEELDEVFAAKNPRKASTARKRLILDAADSVIDVKDL